MRKIVTVLFCDLVGSTAFGEAVDAESAREALGRYHHMAQEAVEAQAGTVAKFIGDGVMALFGVPDIAEDDADRAVAAGLALQEGFGAIRQHIADRYGLDVGLRVGINTGEVVIDDADADVVGDVLNTAARLEAACSPGRVLVGEDTWRLTRARVAYDVLGEVTVKGKAEPVATFQVAEDVAVSEEPATPFVGRAAELAELVRVYEEAQAEQVAKMAAVIGSPGVGKTRLALELARRCGEAMSFDLRCERSGSATFAPIIQLVRSAAAIEPDHQAAEVVDALRALVGDAASDGDRLVDLLASLVGTAEPRSTEESFFAVRRLLEILGARQPVLLVVDDIQWAEPVFLDLLEHLVEWVAGAAVLVVVLARPEIKELAPSFTESGRRVVAVVPMEGLDAAATEELAALLLGVASLPSELTERLPDSTEGNPLFVRELVRMLVDDGVLVRDGDRWVLTVDAGAVEVPPTIQSLLSARVERMPADERKLIELASVVGSEFPRGAVAALVEDSSIAGVDIAIERLRRKDVIEPTGAYRGDDPVFRFHHVLIKDAAYRRLLKQARADLHLRVGEWSQRTAASDVGEHGPTVGFHFEQAYRYRSELGLGDEHTRAIGERAAALLSAAATRALEHDDLPAAGGLARRALAVVEPGAAARPGLLLLACEALLGAGDVANGRAVLAELDELNDDPRLEGWCACFHGQLITLTAPDELRSAEESLRVAAESLAALGDQAGVAKARQVRAAALARLGRVGECEAELDQALTAARAADDRRRVTAVLGSAPVAALWGPSPVPTAGGRCLDVIRLLRMTTKSLAVEAVSVRCQAVLEALRGRFDAARSMIETSRVTAEELGLRHGLMETELYAGIIELLDGEPAAAEPHLRTAYGGLGTLGIGADAGQAAAHLARALLLQGQPEQAQAFAADSAALAGQNPQTLIAARSVQAEILAARGRADEAIQLAEQAVALASGTDIVVDHANANLALARVSAAAGDATRARAALAEAGRLFELKGATVDVGVRLPIAGLLPPTAATNHGLETAARASAGAPPAANAASERSDLISDASRHGRFDELEALVHPAAVTADHARLGWGTGGRGDFVDAMKSWHRVWKGQADHGGVVALRGRRLAVMEYRFGTEGDWSVDRLAVVHVDEAGLLIYLNFYDPGDRDDALAELERLDRPPSSLR